MKKIDWDKPIRGSWAPYKFIGELMPTGGDRFIVLREGNTNLTLVDGFGRCSEDRDRHVWNTTDIQEEAGSACDAVWDNINAILSYFEGHERRICAVEECPAVAVDLHTSWGAPNEKP